MDTTQSTSPIVTEPEILGDEQTREASLSFIEQINAAKAAQGPRPASTVIHGEKRRPGRPRKDGTSPRSPSSGSDKTGSGGTERTQADVDKEMADLEKRRSAKKRKQDEYVRKIVDDANEQLMLWMMGAGVPSAVLYQNGQAPVEVVSDKYTDIGNLVAIKPMQARALASFAVECEYSERGVKMANAMTGSVFGLVIKGLFAGAMVVQYGRQLQQAMAKLQPLLEARNAYLAQQAANQRDGHQAPAQPHFVTLEGGAVR